MADTDIKPVRRIVTIEDEQGTSVACADGPTPDVRDDPARPGYSAARVWVTENTPAPIVGVRETLDLPHHIEPPAAGSVCRVVTFPPDAWFRADVTETQVRDFYEAVGSPGACTYSADAPHPYMQRTETLDFCIVMEGRITLILDTEEVHLEEGDTVIQRGANHAWSNRSDAPCRVFFSQHDGRYDG